MSETHIIGRQRFRIKVNAKKDADLVFSHLSDLNNNRLTQLMDELMTELAPADRTIRIDTLTLNLGSLSEKNFTGEVATRVIAELRKELQEIISSGTADEPEAAPGRPAYELLDFYLRRGYWPWWAARGEKRSPTDLLRSVIEQYPERLPGLLAVINQDVRVLQRLRLQFSEAVLTQVNAQLLGQGWPALQKDISLLEALYDRSPFRAPKTLHKPRATFLALALKLIISSKPTSATAGRSLGILIDELAHLQLVPAASLRRHFLDTLLSFAKEQPSQWPAKKMNRVKRQLAAGPPVTEAATNRSTEVLLRVVIAYLTDGTTPATGPLTSAAAIERLLTEWLGNKEEHLLRIIQPSLAPAATNKRVHNTLRWPTLRALHQWAWAGTWPAVRAYLADVQRLLDEVGVAPATADRLQRSLLADWLALRFKAGAPPPPSEIARLAREEIQSALERETARPLHELLAGTQLLEAAARASWKSDLPDLLAAILKGGPPGPAPADTKPASLQVLRTYLTTGATPASGPLRTAGAIERLLTEWLRKKEPLLLQLLPPLLSREATNKRIHKSLRWPTLRALHQWAWGNFWPDVAVYLAEVESLFEQVGVAPFTADHLRRSLLADWLSFRFAGAKPVGDSPPELIGRLWEAGIRATLRSLERETNRPLRELLAEADLLNPKSGAMWQSDLPKTISVILKDDRSEQFSSAVPARAIGVYRFFLERGYLPEGHAKNGLPRLEEDIYQKVITGNSALFSMLATVLRDEQAFARFRRETALKLLYALAFQLVRDSVADLAGLTKASLPFQPPAAAAAPGPEAARAPDPAEEGDATSRSTTTPAEATGAPAPPEQDTAASPAVNPPLHPRPRPPGEAAENEPGLTARELLFAHLGALYPATGWWEKDRADFLRFSYAFLVRQRLLTDKGTITLAALAGAWAQALQRAAAVPWPVVARHLQAVADDESPAYPDTLKTALRTVAGLTPADPAPSAKNKPEPASPTSDDQEGRQDPALPVPRTEPPDPLVERWADWLSGNTKTPPTEAAFQKLGASDPQYRARLVTLLAGQKINPERLLRLLPAATIREFTDRMVAEISGGHPSWLPTIRRLLLKAAVYPQRTEATQQVSRYALLLLLGSEAVTPRRADNFTGQLLALIAREHQLATPVLAGRLLARAETVTLPANLSIVLQRINARVPPEKIQEIQQETDQQAREVTSLSPPGRNGLFYQAALSYFLENGESPWWEEASLTIDQLFIEAVNSDVKQLTALLAQKPRLARRLFPFLAPEDLHTFIKRALPDYADFLLVWTETLQQLYEKRVLTAPGGPTMTWYAAWTYALRRQAFGSEAFVRAALRTTSDVFTVREDKLLELIREEVALNVALSDVRYYRMAAILQSLPGSESKDSATAFGPTPSGEAGALPDEADPEVAKNQGKVHVEAGADAGAGAGAAEGSVEEQAGKEAADTTAEQTSSVPTPDTGPQEETENGAGQNTPAKEPEAAPPSYGELLAGDVRELRHFLFYGTPVAGRTSSSRATLLQLQERLLLLHPEVAAPLFRAVLRDRIARERWIRYFANALATGLGKLLLGKTLRWVERLWQDLLLLLPGLVPRFNEAEFRQWAWVHLLSYPPVLAQRPDLSRYPESLLESLSQKSGGTFQRLFTDLTELLEQPPAGLQEDWDELLARIKAEKTRQAAEDSPEAASENDHPMEASLYVHNAGLVIMAPFLNRYFGMLGMLEDRVFKDEDAAIRGVLLLEYLASGRTEVPEHELVFNKVLCGLDLETPVPGAIEVSEQEEEISRQMLNAVLQNWDKMSNSTVDNLRGSFILRQGLLREHASNWSLKVETAGYDILLTFLPWTISVISLPWVAKRLEVDWKSNN